MNSLSTRIKREKKNDSEKKILFLCYWGGVNNNKDQEKENNHTGLRVAGGLLGGTAVGLGANYMANKQLNRSRDEATKKVNEEIDKKVKAATNKGQAQLDQVYNKKRKLVRNLDAITESMENAGKNTDQFYKKNMNRIKTAEMNMLDKIGKTTNQTVGSIREAGNKKLDDIVAKTKKMKKLTPIGAGILGLGTAAGIYGLTRKKKKENK